MTNTTINDDVDPGPNATTTAQKDMPPIEPQDSAQKNIMKRSLSSRNSTRGLSHSSLGFLSSSHPVRQFCVIVIRNKWFDRFILLLILLNSLVLALTDYGCVDKVTGDPSKECSWRNLLAEQTEPIFTFIFTLECALKVVSLGFLFGRNTYLKDPWNCLDFVVVVAGLLNVLPNMPNVSAFRTFRVLRPLRSLSALPGLRLLVVALLSSIPALVNVLVLLAVAFAVFGILGVELWSGIFNYRCRLTPYPVRLEKPFAYPPSATYQENILKNIEEFRCLPVENDDSSKSHDTSPWSQRQHCYWPILENYTRICSTGNSGQACPYNFTCGSNYDNFGNARFVDQYLNGSSLRLMDSATFLPKLNYGFTTFDNMGVAFVTMFQAITMEGWTVIMHMIQDSYSKLIAAILFCFLIVFVSFFLLNLTLAVIWEEFEKSTKNFESNQLSIKLDSSNQIKDLSRSMSHRTSVSLRDDFLDVVPPGLGGRVIFNLVTDSAFTSIVIFMILLNTVVLALDHHPMEESFEKNLEYVNFCLSTVFTLEMGLKILGLGLPLYARDPFNIFDAIIVIISLFELILIPPTFLGGAVSSAGALSALRTFRLFRVFKLARNWHALQVLLATIIRTLADVANFAVLLLLFMYIYALIGMQFFANHLHFDSSGHALGFSDAGYSSAEIPRAHFDDLLWAFTTVFQILTGENWNSVLYDCWRGAGPGATVYFLSLICFGDWIVMNLFLAILLGNFENMDDLAPAPAPKLNLKRKVTHMLSLIRKTSAQTAQVLPVSDEEKCHAKIRPSMDPCTEDDTTASSAPLVGPSVEDLSNEGSCKSAPNENNDNPQFKIMTDEKTFKLPMETGENPQNLESKGMVIKKLDGIDTSSNLSGNSLCLFGENNMFRLHVYRIISNPLFDNCILALILISSIILAIDNPLYDQNSLLVKTLSIFDWILTVLFFIEMMLKIIAMGFSFGKKAYLKNSWNVLDFFIVIISVLSLIADLSGGSSSLKSLRSLRTLRALRPLRMISRRPGLKLVVNAMFRSVPSIVNVLFVCVLFLMIFSVVGINYFKGTFMACQGDAYDNLSEEKKYLISNPVSLKNSSSNMLLVSKCNFSSAVITSRDICECWGLEWEPTLSQNFNNIGNAMGTLFELSTTEGWVDVMYAGVDSTGINMQPKRDHISAWVFFFISYMIVGSFFAMNLFVGVVIDNFNRMKEELGNGNVFLTEAQSLWIKTQQVARKIKPIRKIPIPSSSVGSFCYHVTSSAAFENFIMICITINAAVMGVTHFGQNDSFSTFLNIMNILFASTFTVEAIMKLIAQKKYYFTDGWNQFDFAIVCGSNFGYITELVFNSSTGSPATIIRLFRLGRIFRLVNRFKSIRQLFNTLLLTLPSLANIGSLLFLLFFIYAVMGVQLYATVGYNGAHDEHTHFRDFGTAILSLMSFSTGENWNGFMYDLYNGYNNSVGCSSDVTFNSSMCGFNDFDGCIPLNGCGSWTIVPFLYSFTLVVTFVMLNLFIAVILEGFSESNEDDIVLAPHQLTRFTQIWADYDPNATCFMPVKYTTAFFQAIFTSLHLAQHMTEKDIVNRISHIDLAIYEGKSVHFKDCMKAVAHEAMLDAALRRGEDLENLNLDLPSIQQWGVVKKSKPQMTSASLETYYAAQTVQRSFLAYKQRKGIQKSEQECINSSPPTNSDTDNNAKPIVIDRERNSKKERKSQHTKVEEVD